MLPNNVTLKKWIQGSGMLLVMVQREVPVQQKKHGSCLLACKTTVISWPIVLEKKSFENGNITPVVLYPYHLLCP